MITIRAIALRELEKWILSDEFRTMQVVPITRHRAISHINNPGAQGDDPVLWITYENDRMTGYLGALPDLFRGQKEIFRGAWLSCLWIDKNFRGRGIASKLLKHAFLDWKNRIAIRDYTPEAKTLYESTGKFVPLSENTGNGLRAYLRFDLHERLPRKFPLLSKISGLLNRYDGVLNAINESRLAKRMQEITIATGYSFEELPAMDEESSEFIRGFTGQTLNVVDQKLLNWIMSFPWVLEDADKENFSVRYHFSSYDKRFLFRLMKVKNAQNNLSALLLFSIRNNHLKLPYAFFSPSVTPVVGSGIINLMQQLKLFTFTSYHPEICGWLKKNTTPFCFMRKQHLPAMISRDFSNELGGTSGKILYDGDSGCGFV
ncbi:MAG: GNAT family N-acetyltransferase [Bacteroidetes bacterium]|nr:GNAT family N-acetyltransferase [Bacteroidota bacterium]